LDLTESSKKAACCHKLERLDDTGDNKKAAYILEEQMTFLCLLLQVRDGSMAPDRERPSQIFSMTSLVGERDGGGR
jgi:hypothetical protein